MQNRLECKLKKMTVSKRAIQKPTPEQYFKSELKWTGGEISVQLAKGVCGYKRTVYIYRVSHLQCIQTAHSVPQPWMCARGKAFYQQQQPSKWLCMCLPKLHLVAMMQSGVGVRSWSEEGGQSRVEQIKILPSSRPFDFIFLSPL